MLHTEIKEAFQGGCLGTMRWKLPLTLGVESTLSDPPIQNLANLLDYFGTSLPFLGRHVFHNVETAMQELIFRCRVASFDSRNPILSP